MFLTIIAGTQTTFGIHEVLFFSLCCHNERKALKLHSSLDGNNCVLLIWLVRLQCHEVSAALSACRNCDKSVSPLRRTVIERALRQSSVQVSILVEVVDTEAQRTASIIESIGVV
jgi:hypothetical protein